MSEQTEHQCYHIHPDMTLRDWVAFSAMMALIKGESFIRHDVVSQSFKAADEFIKKRSEK